MGTKTNGKWVIPIEVLRAKNRPENSTIKIRNGKFMVYYQIREYVKGISKVHTKSTLGQIVLENGEYVFMANKIYTTEVNGDPITLKEYGGSYILNKVGLPFYEVLKENFDGKSAHQIYASAILKVMYSKLMQKNIANKYQHSYISNQYKDIPLSSDALTKSFYEIGSMTRSINRYCQSFLDKSSGTVAVDGTLIECSSDFNSYATPCRKQEIRAVSCVMIFDVDKNMPLAYGLFSGDTIDSHAFIDLLERYSCANCLVIADSGFYSDSNAQLMEKKNIDYIMPLRRNSRLLKEGYDFKFSDGVFAYQKDNIKYQVIKLSDTRSIYCFNSDHKASNERSTYLREHGNIKFPNPEFDEEDKYFGCIFLISESGKDPYLVYLGYKSRWGIEIGYDYYKNELMLDTLNAHSKENTNALMFINFIALQIFYAFMNYLIENKYNTKKNSYRDILNNLMNIHFELDNDGIWKFQNANQKECVKYESLGIIREARTSLKSRDTFEMIKRNNELERAERKKAREDRELEKAHIKASEPPKKRGCHKLSEEEKQVRKQARLKEKAEEKNIEEPPKNKSRKVIERKNTSEILSINEPVLKKRGRPKKPNDSQ